MILSWSWFAQISQAWNRVQRTNDSSNATSRALWGLRCSACSTLPSRAVLLLFPGSGMPQLTSLEEGSKDGEGEEWWGATTKARAGRTALASIAPKGEKPGREGQGRSVCWCCHPLPLPELGGGGGKRQRTVPGSVLICCRRATGRLPPPRIEHHPPLGKNECAVRRELWTQTCGTWPCAKAEPGLHRLWACLCGQNEGRWAAGCSQCGGPDGPVFS